MGRYSQLTIRFPESPVFLRIHFTLRILLLVRLRPLMTRRLRYACGGCVQRLLSRNRRRS